MNLSAFISERLASGRKLLVPYLCAGFPEPEATLPLLEALADGGADAIELGMPFSDPVADGPVLQAASQRALRAGMNLERTLDLALEFTRWRPGVPLLLMGYVNPILAFGVARFALHAQAAGIAGLLIPDLPPEAWARLQTPSLPPLLPFAAPNTPGARLRELGQLEAPFLYAVSVLGVTGARMDLGREVPEFLVRAKACSGLPVLAGFGLSTPEQAAALAPACDGVILGSALARVLEEAAAQEWEDAARAFLNPFRRVLDTREAPCC